jgi:hypothetical protein
MKNVILVIGILSLCGCGGSGKQEHVSSDASKITGAVSAVKCAARTLDSITPIVSGGHRLRGTTETDAHQTVRNSRGDLFAIGLLEKGQWYDSWGRIDYWTVRKSSDNGSTWSTIEDGSSILGASPDAILVGPSDELVMTGSSFGLYGAQETVPFVRLSRDNGHSWQTLPPYRIRTGASEATFFQNCAFTPDANLACSAVTHYTPATYTDVVFDFNTGIWTTVATRLAGTHAPGEINTNYSQFGSTGGGSLVRVRSREKLDASGMPATGTRYLESSADGGVTWNTLYSVNFESPATYLSFVVDGDDIYSVVYSQVAENFMVSQQNLEIRKMTDTGSRQIFQKTLSTPGGQGTINDEFFYPYRKFTRVGGKLVLFGSNYTGLFQLKALVSENGGETFQEGFVEVNGAGWRVPYGFGDILAEGASLIISGSRVAEDTQQIWSVESLTCE